MTVHYTHKVTTATWRAPFLRALFRWRGSIYKAIWLNLVLFMLLYFFLSYVQMVILNERQKKTFVLVSRFCQNFVKATPLSFVLGFYVDQVIARWWEYFTLIPRVDGVGTALLVAARGDDQRSRLIRRTIMRYMNVAFIMALRIISPPVKDRFPTWECLEDSGLILSTETEIIKTLSALDKLPKYWIPLVWASNIASRARNQKRILDDFSMNFLLDQINDFRGKLQTLINYDWVSIPIVYTQVVTIATYVYFGAALMGRQTPRVDIDQASMISDSQFPLFLFLEFFFYMGWLNVAEILIHPLGHDDDDHDIQTIIDRNIQISYFMANDVMNFTPWNPNPTIGDKRFSFEDDEANNLTVLSKQNEASLVTQKVNL